LGAPLDVFVVRKLGVPGREELAMGAIDGGGVTVIDDDVVRARTAPAAGSHPAGGRAGGPRAAAPGAGLPGGAAFPEVADQVIVVDDGLATGSSMRAAAEVLRRLRPARIVVAVPAAPESTCR
jgi:predicted phosphoribosyltransferase